MTFARTAGRSLYHYGVRLPALWAWYWFYKVRGKPWTSYYADVLDWGIKDTDVRAFAPAHRERGVLQLRYLQAHGLTPANMLLDFGCGYGRAAIHLIEYLEADRYVGVDISLERLRIAQELVTEQGLWHKRPRFIRNSGAHLRELGGLVFDVIWSYGVLGHMPWEDITVLFEHLPSLMHPGTDVYATGYFLPDGTSLSVDRKLSVKDFYYPQSQVMQLADRCRLQCVFMDDFLDRMNFGDIEPGYDYMIHLKLKGR